MNRELVLLVEDDEGNSTVTCIYLGVLGFDCFHVRDGLAALRVIPRLKPDVILLDLRMDGMDGWDFLRTYEGPAPVVVFSAWGGDTVLPREPFAIVVKPSDIRSVAITLREAIASSTKH